jgi:hypothetical protein
MEEAINYLRDVFNVKLDVQPFSKRELDAIPLYIGAIYKLSITFLDEVKICLAELKGDELPTPSQLKKHQEIIVDKTGCPVVFVLDRIESYIRNRLLQQKIDFVIADKQIFLPSLLITLKEYQVPKTSGKNTIQPAAQCILLYHLQKQNLSGMGFRQIAKFLPYSYLTTTRAIDNLAEAGLCAMEGSREKTIFFDPEKSKLWQDALKWFVNPIKRKVFINEPLPDYLTVRSSLNALACYTSINDGGTKPIIAIWEKNFRELHKNGLIKMYSQYDGEFAVEQWSYDPLIMADKGVVDPLSLYLIFRDETDERISYEIDQMIKKIQW